MGWLTDRKWPLDFDWCQRPEKTDLAVIGIVGNRLISFLYWFQE